MAEKRSFIPRDRDCPHSGIQLIRFVHEFAIPRSAVQADTTAAFSGSWLRRYSTYPARTPVFLSPSFSSLPDGSPLASFGVWIRRGPRSRQDPHHPRTRFARVERYLADAERVGYHQRGTYRSVDGSARQGLKRYPCRVSGPRLSLLEPFISAFPVQVVFPGNRVSDSMLQSIFGIELTICGTFLQLDPIQDESPSVHASVYPVFRIHSPEP